MEREILDTAASEFMAEAIDLVQRQFVYEKDLMRTELKMLQNGIGNKGGGLARL